MPSISNDVTARCCANYGHFAARPARLVFAYSRRLSCDDPLRRLALAYTLHQLPRTSAGDRPLVAALEMLISFSVCGTRDHVLLRPAK